MNLEVLKLLITLLMFSFATRETVKHLRALSHALKRDVESGDRQRKRWSRIANSASLALLFSAPALYYGMHAVEGTAVIMGYAIYV